MAIQMVQAEVDGIEFYVSIDGTQSGMSESGLARLCGVNRFAIRLLIKKINEPGNKELPKILEPFTGKTLELQEADNKNQAKILSSDLCAAIVEYYAFESKASNETARFSFRKFGSKGMDLWIKEVTGYQKDQIPESKEILSLSDYYYFLPFRQSTMNLRNSLLVILSSICSLALPDILPLICVILTQISWIIYLFRTSRFIVVRFVIA